MKTKIKKLTTMIMLCTSIFCYAVGFSLISSTILIIVAIISLLPAMAFIYRYFNVVVEYCFVGKERNDYLCNSITISAVYLLLIAVTFALYSAGNYGLSWISLILALMLIDGAADDDYSDVTNITVFCTCLICVFWIFITIDAYICSESKYQEIKNRYEKYNKAVILAEWLSEQEKADLEAFYFDDIMHTKDSIYLVSTKKIQSICTAIETTYSNIKIPQPQELYVKRCWINSDKTPSTYTADGKFKTSLTVKAGFFTAVSQQKNNVEYSSNFVEENETQYVNVVLSDNSYYRLSLKKGDNNSNWLLVKEGDKVIKTYHKNEFDINNLNQNAVYSKIQLIFKSDENKKEIPYRNK